MLVCNTKQDDVKNGVEALLKSHVDTTNYPPILQVSMKDYKHLTTITDRGEMSEQAKQKEAKHFINLNTLTVHKKECLYSGTNTVKAALIRVKSTGLRICKHCQ